MKNYVEIKCKNCGSPNLPMLIDGTRRCEYCGTVYARIDEQNDPNRIISSSESARSLLETYVSKGLIPEFNDSLFIIKNSSNPKMDFEKIIKLHGDKLIVLESNTQGKYISSYAKQIESRAYTLLHPFDVALLLADPRKLDDYHQSFQKLLSNEYIERCQNGELLIFKASDKRVCYNDYGELNHDSSNYTECIFSDMINQPPYKEISGLRLNSCINESIISIYIQGLKNADLLNKFRDEWGMSVFESFFLQYGFDWINYGTYKNELEKYKIYFLYGRTLIITPQNGTYNYYGNWIILSKPILENTIIDFNNESVNQIKSHDEKKKKQLHEFFSNYCGSSSFYYLKNKKLIDINYGYLRDSYSDMNLKISDSPLISLEVSTYYVIGSHTYNNPKTTVILGDCDEAFNKLAMSVNRCTFCGGSFNLFGKKKICKKCGKEKDYPSINEVWSR